MYKFWLCLLSWNRFSVGHGAQKSVQMFTTLVNYKAVPLHGLLEVFGYCSQQSGGVTDTVLQHDKVRVLFCIF